MATKLEKVLSDLQKAGGVISIALPAVGGAITLVSGIIKEFKSVGGSSGPDGGSTEYQFVLSAGQKELDEAEANAEATLDVVNAELTRLGKPIIPPYIPVAPDLPPKSDGTGPDPEPAPPDPAAG